jgi:hypothetical protein
MVSRICADLWMEISLPDDDEAEVRFGFGGLKFSPVT